MRKSLTILIFTCLITSCTLPRPQARPPEASASPTSAANQPTPSKTSTPTSNALSTPTLISTQPGAYFETPIPASALQGTWHRYTAADGFCTDWPRFIGGGHIGLGTTSICDFYEGKGSISIVVPQGSRVNAANIFPPGGGQEFATDVGICFYPAWADSEWRCYKYGDYGVEPYPFPNEEIKAIVPLSVEAVYMSENKVFFRNNVYQLTDIVGAEDLRATWLAVSSEILGEGFLVPEIWVGTNAHGIIVIQPDTGNITRHTIDNGLPGNVIRDINAEHCPKYCDFRDIWVATDKGVAHWDGSNWVTYTTEDGLPSNDIRGVASRTRNTVWVATSGGAAYFGGNSWKVFTHANGLPDGDLNGVLWQGNEILFSTRGSGLIVFSMDGQ